MAFMQPEITAKQLWYEVDGPSGTEYVPAFLVIMKHEQLIPHGLAITEEKTPCLFYHLQRGVQDYIEGSADFIDTITLIEGYGARLSAPGFMDCTEWSVHDTAEEAQEYLDTYYSDDDAQEG